MEDSEKSAYAYQEFLKRLSTQKFWKEFKKIYNIKNVDQFGLDVYERLEAYHSVLKSRVQDAIEKFLDTDSIEELVILRGEIETNKMRSGQLRNLLRNEEEIMKELLKGVNNKLEKPREKPEHIFYHPKPKEFFVYCPSCGEKTRISKYGNSCQFCYQIIADPWTAHTICPGCGTLVNVKNIRDDPGLYNLDHTTNMIDCPNENCQERFDWKKYKREPEKRMLKYCEVCDKPYNPDKRNWPRQRRCPECIAKGRDLFRLENPDYHKKYREKREKK